MHTMQGAPKPVVAYVDISIYFLLNPSLISMTGFDHKTILYILPQFDSHYNQLTPFSIENHFHRQEGTSRKRTRSMSAADCLGVSRTRYGTRIYVNLMSLKPFILHNIFVLCLQFARPLLVKVLTKGSLVCIEMPDQNKVTLYTMNINSI